VPDTPNTPDIPIKQEALQYITYSAKELLYLLNEKVDRLDGKISEMAIEQAKLDARYVSIPQFRSYQQELANTRRFAIASGIAGVSALSGVVGMLINSVL
jgi:hypothetical protein